MIQRIQTLFLLQVVFLAASLMFVPVQLIPGDLNAVPVKLLPLHEGPFRSTAGHLAGCALNALGLILAAIAIFLFKKRAVQVRLCYVIAAIYAVLVAMIAVCPFVHSLDGEEVLTTKGVFGYLICAVCILAAVLAARFVKKDIELLKSTERIR